MSAFIRKEERETLVCKECNEELPLSMFVRKGKNKKSGALQYSSRCKVCYNQHVKQQPSYNTEARRRIEKLDFSNSIKVKCVVCGYDRCSSALDFHHVDDNEKEATISWMVTNRAYTLDDIRKEMMKCVVVCSNCHREHHSGLIDVSVYPRAM